MARVLRQSAWSDLRQLLQSGNASSFGRSTQTNFTYCRFRSIVDLMKRRIEPSFRALATAGLELANSYLQLHARGLCYRDISFGNAFFDPYTGEILICDNDNVTVDNQSHSAVYGTPRFMAPEIVRGEPVPSTQLISSRWRCFCSTCS